MLNPDKPKKIVFFKPTEKEDTRKKMFVTRPNEHAILSKEVYQNPRTPISEKETIEALLKMEQEGRVESLWTNKSKEKVLWWVMR